MSSLQPPKPRSPTASRKSSRSSAPPLSPVSINPIKPQRKVTAELSASPPQPRKLRSSERLEVKSDRAPRMPSPDPGLPLPQTPPQGKKEARTDHKEQEISEKLAVAADYTALPAIPDASQNAHEDDFLSARTFVSGQFSPSNRPPKLSLNSYTATKVAGSPTQETEETATSLKRNRFSMMTLKSLTSPTPGSRNIVTQMAFNPPASAKLPEKAPINKRISLKSWKTAPGRPNVLSSPLPSPRKSLGAVALRSHPPSPAFLSPTNLPVLSPSTQESVHSIQESLGTPGPSIRNSPEMNGITALPTPPADDTLETKRAVRPPVLQIPRAPRSPPYKREKNPLSGLGTVRPRTAALVDFLASTPPTSPIHNRTASLPRTTHLTSNEDSKARIGLGLGARIFSPSSEAAPPPGPGGRKMVQPDFATAAQFDGERRTKQMMRTSSDKARGSLLGSRWASLFGDRKSGTSTASAGNVGISTQRRESSEAYKGVGKDGVWVPSHE